MFFSAWPQVHTLLQTTPEDILAQFLTTNSTGFLRDCVNMIQGVQLCIERLEKWFVNAQKWVKPLSEVLGTFREKVLALKLFETYEPIITRKIEDALVNRLKMTWSTTLPREKLVSQYLQKCTSEDIATFDTYVLAFNKHIREIRNFLLLEKSDEHIATYLQKKISSVRRIIWGLEGLILGK